MGNGMGGIPLSPYVPRMSAEWELDAPGARWREMDATCCFVDISGFTALSERLAKRGRIGAEELTEVLSHVFSRMLDVAYSKGGALLKFGGDALLLIYTGDDHARLAAEGAVAMRAALREARTLPTSVGRLNLRMSIGLHSGTFHLFRVGHSHREFLITGPAASATTRMEATAEAGEIVVSGDTARRLPKSAVGQPKGEGHLLRWRNVVEGGPGPIPARAVAERAVESSVPVALRLRLGQRGGESEHRLASVGFVKFLGTDDLIASQGPAATADALDAIVQAVQYAADREGVTFLASDLDANGGKIILVTGVPTTQEDDEGRLLRAARTVMEHPLPLPVRIGVNRGHVFSGDIGTPYRRTFTIMGDTVNLAARLMAAAKPGEIYATGAVLDQARTRFGTEAIEPFYVKGKSEPVQAYRVGEATGTRSDSFGTLPFRGRDKELTALTHALEAAATGCGGSVLVEAERGVGKTRLIDEFKASSPAEAVLWLQGEPHNTGIPYLPLRNALRRLLDIGARDRKEAGRELLDAILRLDEHLVPFAPLLAVILDAEVAPTPETEGIAEEFVRQRMADIVVDTLDAACATPLLIVTDDAHWFDETTSEICERLAGAADKRRWLIVATRRPQIEGGFTPPHPLLISLMLLGDDVAHEVAELATESAPLRPHERDQVVSRAGGNPLFLEELLRIVRDNEDSLPDSLDAVAMREIDTLPTTPRRVLRLASILGRSFETALLTELLKTQMVEGGDDWPAELGAQLQLDADGTRMRFRHALLQEAAYQSLPFRQRLGLHRAAGEAIERGPTDPDEAAPHLSYHFLEAQDWSRTWRYARLAAESAQKAHAPGEVATHLERAITAARRLGDVQAEDLFTVYGDLGRTLVLLGEYERADDAYRRAMLTKNSDPVQRALIAYRRAHLRSEFLGRPSSAIRQLRAGNADLATVGPSAAGVRALLLAEEAAVRDRQGRLSEGIRCAMHAVREAEKAGDKRALALSLDVLNSLRYRSGEPGMVADMHRAVELYEELGDEVQVAIVLNNLAGMAYFAGRWDEAAGLFTRSAEAARAAGDLAGTASAHLNLGDVLVSQGRIDEALDLLGPASRTLESYGYRAVTASAEMYLGRATAFHGELEQGIALERSALSTFDEIGLHIESLEASARLAEVLVFGNRFIEARDALVRARELNHGVEESPLSALVDRVELTLAATVGDQLTLAARLDSFLERAKDLDAPYEALVVLAVLEHMGDASRHEEVRRLMTELGVVRLPMLATSEP